MTLNEILIVMQNRIIALKNARLSAVNSGDIENLIIIDNDLITTETSIEQISKKIADLQG